MKNTKEPNHSNIDCGRGTGKNRPPPEKSAIKTLTDGIKKLASGFIKHSPSAETDNTFFIELIAVMEEMDESQRRELQPVADVFLQACRERRENEMYDKMLASLERRYPGMPGMMLASYESWYHVRRESARPQPEEDGDIKLSTEDMRTLVKCFKGNEDNAIKFWEAINQLEKDIEKTRLVNQLVKEGKIDSRFKHHTLFTLLKNNGLYEKSQTNWYNRVP